MNKSDKERLKKIISLWNALNEEIKSAISAYASIQGR